MSTFTIILLLIIIVLIASDVFFLYKIFKSVARRKKYIPDERYFELKYNINLLKAVSAILIFLLGFFGFTTYQDITSIVESDFEERFNFQEQRVERLDSIVKNYETVVKSLKSEEGKSIENLNDVKREFGLINRKVAQTEKALKYVPGIYVVKNLKFDTNKINKKLGNGIKFEFKNLRTIYNESLPKFKNPPLIIVQGDNANYVFNEKTKDYFDISLYIASSSPNSSNINNFSIWIISTD